MKQEGVLAVDVGTSSIRVSIFTLNEGIIDTKKETNRLEPRFSSEHLWKRIEKLIKSSVASFPELKICSIAISSFLGWVVLDAERKPAEKAWSWMASPAGHYVKDILNKLPQSTARKTGRKPTDHLTAFLWGESLKENPESIILSFKDYCIFKLTGVLKMDKTHASYTGLLSIKEREWDSDMLEHFSISSGSLPQLAEGTDIASLTNETVTRNLSLESAVPVALGGPDGAMAILGSGGFSAGKLVEVMGSTDVIFQIETFTDNPGLYREGLIQNCFLEPSLYCTGGPTGMTGSALDWFMKEWQIQYDDNSFKRIVENWNSVKTAEDGLFIIPEFNGARVPDWNPFIRGTIIGIKPSHTRSELLKAAVEGVAFLSARLLQKIRMFHPRQQEIIAVGGGAKNQLLLKTRAAVANCSMSVPQEIEASTVGAIALAGKAANFYASAAEAIQQLNPIMVQIHPEQLEVEKYQSFLKDYEAFSDHMNQWYTLNKNRGV